MAITDVLAEIKDYFLNWHTNNYVTLHESTINSLNTEITNRTDGDRALGTRIDNLTASQIKDNENNNTQTTLTNLQNQKLNKNTSAQAGPRKLVSDHGETGGEDTRGFTQYIPEPRTNGVMTWKDKAALAGMSIWEAPTWGSIPKCFTVYYNPSLRIVHAKFYVKDCTWLAKETTYLGAGMSSPGGWSHIRPISNVWAPTNVVGVQVCVASDGTYMLRSDRKIAKHDFNASLFWFYGDSHVYSKIKAEE